MNKLIPLLFFVFLAFSASAQSEDNQQQIQVLIQKVDSLTHELSYLKQSYEIYTLNSDLTSFRNEVYASALDVKIDIFNRNFDRRLGKIYKEHYESCEKRRKSFDNLIKAKKEQLMLMIFTQSYTDNEVSLLMSNYGLIDDILDYLDKSMNLYKASIDAYLDLM